MSRRVLLILLLLVILGALLWPIETGDYDRLQETFWRALHFPAMALATLLLALGLSEASDRPLRRTIWIMLVVVPLIEGLQEMTGRTPAWSDVMMGWAGVLAGGVVHFSAMHRKPGALGVGVGFVLLLTGAAGMPSAGVVLDRWMADRSYPLLASFRTPLEVGRWEAHGCDISRSGDHAVYGGASLAIKLSDRSAYPGAFMTDFIRDWSASSALYLDVYLSGDEELNGWIRVDDEPAPDYGDRFQKRTTLLPGDNVIRVDLDESFVTPRGRPIQKDSIQTWGLFFDRAGAGRVLYLDAAYLSLSASVEQ